MSDVTGKGYRVVMENPAWRQLMKLDEKTQNKIADAIYALEKEPRPSGCKKLKGEERSYRVRVGTFRVLYELYDDVLFVLVVEIVNRRDAYE